MVMVFMVMQTSALPWTLDADAPPHSFMRYNTNRDLGVTSRGLGATPTVPHTTCGEENLLMEGDM
jgi:hypothetical protein